MHSPERRQTFDRHPADRKQHTLAQNVEIAAVVIGPGLQERRRSDSVSGQEDSSKNHDNIHGAFFLRVGDGAEQTKPKSAILTTLSLPSRQLRAAMSMCTRRCLEEVRPS